MVSIWEEQSFYAPPDILIVGAGLMGLWSALELKKRNSALRITLLERNTTPLGASSRNAGFACFGSPTELIYDADTYGVDRMLEVVGMRYRGIEKIRSHFSDDETGFDTCGGYECINRDYSGWDTLDDRLVWLNQLLEETCGQHIFSDASGKLPGLGLRGFDCLIENSSEAALHSGKLVQALTRKVQASGVTILYGMELLQWQSTNNGVQVQTKQGLDLSARSLLFCTNAFTQQFVKELPVKPARGQVIVTSPIENLALKGTFHYDEGFYYWRNLGNRILLGGARNTAFAEEETTDLTGSVQLRNTLEAFLRDHIDPSYQYTIDYHWSGVMGFTEDKAPFVGEIGDNAFAAIACNGIGVALTPVMAELVVEKMGV